LVDGQAAHPNAGCDRFVTRSGVGRQQNLRTLELAYRVLTSAQQRLEFITLSLAEFDPIA